MLAGSLAPFASQGRPTGVIPASRRLTIQVWLAPQIAAASRFASAVSTPGSSRFRHYLSPAGYTARFGPALGAVSAVESWLRGEGFAAISTDTQRTYVRATAAAARIESAFRVRLRTYRAAPAASADGHVLYANDRPVSLPSALAGRVLGVTGLDDAAPVTPLIRPDGRAARAARSAGDDATCSHYYGQHLATGLPRKFGTRSFPTIICGYSALQLRKAYHASLASTGKGQTIALVELGLTRDMFKTLHDYAKVNHLPAPSPARYEELSLGNNGCGDPFDFEEQLDVEVSHDLAPDANQLVIGGDSCAEGDFGLQGLLNAEQEVLDGADGHPLATIISNSWEEVSGSQPPAALRKITHAILVRAVAEGVGTYWGSGDQSGVNYPSSDPFATSVGGTTLGIGKTGGRLFETGWSTGHDVIKRGEWTMRAELAAAGGGPSKLFQQPAYQKGVVPPALGKTRSTPDLSAAADPFTGMAIGLLSFKHGLPSYHQIPVGGTSEATPLVAGIVADAQQGQPVPFGFINPAIYQLAGTSAFFDNLPLTSHSRTLYRAIECDTAVFAGLCGLPKPVRTLAISDDQNPHLGGYTGQVTLKGYDNMTGLGSPDVPRFISLLRKLEG